MPAKRLPTCPKLAFQVKPIHFDVSTSNKSDACSVAEAMKERYPHLRGISVDLSTIRATDKAKDLRYIWFTPPSAQAVITMTDPDLAAAAGLSGQKMTKSIWVTLKSEGSQVIPIVERRKRITSIRLAKAKRALAKAKAEGAAKAVKAAKAMIKNPRIVLGTGNGARGDGTPRIIGGKEPPMHAQHTVTRRSGARRLANFDFGRLTG